MDSNANSYTDIDSSRSNFMDSNLDSSGVNTFNLATQENGFNYSITRSAGSNFQDSNLVVGFTSKLLNEDAAYKFSLGSDASLTSSLSKSFSGLLKSVSLTHSIAHPKSRQLLLELELQPSNNTIASVQVTDTELSHQLAFTQNEYMFGLNLNFNHVQKKLGLWEILARYNINNGYFVAKKQFNGLHRFGNTVDVGYYYKHTDLELGLEAGVGADSTSLLVVAEKNVQCKLGDVDLCHTLKVSADSDNSVRLSASKQFNEHWSARTTLNLSSWNLLKVRKSNYGFGLQYE